MALEQLFLPHCCVTAWRELLLALWETLAGFLPCHRERRHLIRNRK